MNQNALSIETQNLTRVYRRGSEEIIAVNSISLTINKGDFVSIIGPSGSGKTTLINLLGCLDNPTSSCWEAGRSSATAPNFLNMI
jgi:putative ABC transport system ATP-binding protein